LNNAQADLEDAQVTAIIMVYKMMQALLNGTTAN